jgi:hypothetical protein
VEGLGLLEIGWVFFYHPNPLAFHVIPDIVEIGVVDFIMTTAVNLFLAAFNGLEGCHSISGVAELARLDWNVCCRAHFALGCSVCQCGSAEELRLAGTNSGHRGFKYHRQQVEFYQSWYASARWINNASRRLHHGSNLIRNEFCGALSNAELVISCINVYNTCVNNTTPYTMAVHFTIAFQIRRQVWTQP